MRRFREPLHIVFQAGDALKRHAPEHSALDRTRFIRRKIHPLRLFQKTEKSVQRGVSFRPPLFLWPPVFLRFRVQLFEMRRAMLGDPRDVDRDAFRRQHEIHAAGLHGAVRHPIIFRRFFILGERHAAFGFDRLDPQRAVRPGARQDHAKRLSLALVGQTPQK